MHCKFRLTELKIQEEFKNFFGVKKCRNQRKQRN